MPDRKPMVIPDVPDADLVSGYLGRGVGGRWRAYQSLDLAAYVEFRSQDVVHVLTLSDGSNPLGGSLIWLRKGARVERVGSVASPNQSQFLDGDVTRAFLSSTERGAGLGGETIGGRFAIRTLNRWCTSWLLPCTYIWC